MAVVRTRKKKKFTAAQYLALEEKAEFRSEFDDGVVVAMSGGTLNHAQITANVSRNLGNRISRDCRALASDVKVHVENYRKFYYPDALVICGKPEFYENRKDTVLNPVLIVEVLSDSTEAKDRGEKFFAYRTVESFEEYVLISQHKFLVETFTKQGDGSWRYLATIGSESKVYLKSVDLEISMQEIYDLVEFEQE